MKVIDVKQVYGQILDHTKTRENSESVRGNTVALIDAATNSAVYNGQENGGRRIGLETIGSIWEMAPNRKINKKKSIFQVLRHEKIGNIGIRLKKSGRID